MLKSTAEYDDGFFKVPSRLTSTTENSVTSSSSPSKVNKLMAGMQRGRTVNKKQKKMNTNGMK